MESKDVKHLKKVSTRQDITANYDADLAIDQREFFRNKIVLITGGTGSLGKILCKKIIQYEIKKIIIYSRDEFKQKQMKKEFCDVLEKMVFRIGDVRDYDSLLRALKDVNIVFHTAALKDIIVDENNPLEAIETNIIGAKNVVYASINQNVDKVINISTDKAIRPKNAYGATKLLTEKIVSAASKESQHTILCTVRYGNVLGSRGSIVPLVIEQIITQNKVEMTDPDMTRYIMSLHEAAGLVLSAAKIARGGETFVLKMKSIRLDSYIKNIILCATEKLGLPEPKNIEIIGSRQGEKKHEVLLFQDENVQRIKDKLFIITSNPTSDLSEDKKWYSSEIASKISDSEIQKIILDYITENISTTSKIARFGALFSV